MGTILGTLFKSIFNFMQVMIDSNEYDTIQNKIMKNFKNINVIILFVAIRVRKIIEFGKFQYCNVILKEEDKKIINVAIEYMEFLNIKEGYIDQLSGEHILQLLYFII